MSILRPGRLSAVLLAALLIYTSLSLAPPRESTIGTGPQVVPSFTRSASAAACYDGRVYRYPARARGRHRLASVSIHVRACSNQAPTSWRFTAARNTQLCCRENVVFTRGPVRRYKKTARQIMSATIEQDGIILANIKWDIKVAKNGSQRPIVSVINVRKSGFQASEYYLLKHRYD